MRLNPEATMVALTCSHVSSMLKDSMSVLGVMTCLASLDPKFTMPSRMRCSSSDRSALSVNSSACSRSSTLMSAAGLASLLSIQRPMPTRGFQMGRSTCCESMRGAAMSLAKSTPNDVA